MLFTACSPLKKVPQDKYLLAKNKIELNGASEGSASSYIRQKPNKTTLGVRVYLQVHNLAGKKENKINDFLLRVGEPPVIYDSSAAAKSAQQIARYFFSEGYFNATCTYKAEKKPFRRKRTRVVTYMVKPGSRYKVRNISYSAESRPIKPLIEEIKQNSYLQAGQPYQAEQLDEERERINEYLRRSGYYFFSKKYVFFEVDSSLGSHEVDLAVKILNKRVRSGDTTVQEEHIPYRVSNIYIRPDYQPRKPNLSPTDSIYHRGYYLVYRNELQIKPRSLTDAVRFDTLDWFNSTFVENTYNHFRSLQSFRTINIQFEEDSTDFAKINAFISLAPLKKRSFTLETEGTHEVGNLGINVQTGIRNRSLFGGLEQFDLSVRYSVESQNTLRGVGDPFFNTSEFGLEANLRFPIFLLPFETEGLFPKRFQPFTNIHAEYVREERVEFTRVATSGSFGYIWNENVAKTHIIDLINITSVNLDAKEGFEFSSNPFLANAFRTQLITSLDYSFIYNSQNYFKKRYDNFYTYFRGNLEMSGLLLHSLSKPLDLSTNADGTKLLWNLPYSHFLRADADLRFYYKLGKRRQVAFRTFAGLGHVLENSDVMPFERQYFAGGSTDIRAFTAYQLGPGNFSSDSVRFNTGDVKLTISTEYRFSIFNDLLGAIFLDVGNIWTGNRADPPAGTVFQLNRFHEQLAVGTGFGIRYDFSFFIIRLDLGVPLRDPANTENKWIINKYQLRDTKFNIGLGYPF